MKKFESGYSVPTVNNLGAIQNALEHAGVEFVSEEQGGPGVLARRLRFRAYIPGEGLHLEASYVDLFLEGPDNDFDFGFKIGDAALTALAGQRVVSEAEAKTIIQANKAKIIGILRNLIVRAAFSSTGGKPIEVTVTDINSG